MEVRQIAEGVAVRRRLPSSPVPVVTYVVARTDANLTDITGMLMPYSTDTYLYIKDDIVAAMTRLTTMKNVRIVVYVDREADAKRLRPVSKHLLAAINTDILAVYRVLTPQSAHIGITPPIQIGKAPMRLLETFYQNITVSDGIICSMTSKGYVGHKFILGKTGVATTSRFDVEPCLRRYIADRMTEINDRYSRGALIFDAHFESIRGIPGYENVVALYEKNYNTMDKWGILYGLMFEKKAKKKTRALGRGKKVIATGVTAMPEITNDTTPTSRRLGYAIVSPSIPDTATVVIPHAFTPTPTPVSIAIPTPRPSFEDVLESNGDVWSFLFDEWNMVATAMPFCEFVSVYIEKMTGRDVSLDGLPAVLKKLEIRDRDDGRIVHK
jgi:hypothetical protein